MFVHSMAPRFARRSQDTASSPGVSLLDSAWSKETSVKVGHAHGEKSGVGSSVRRLYDPGKSEDAAEDGRVGAPEAIMEGDLAFLLYDVSEVLVEVDPSIQNLFPSVVDAKQTDPNRTAMGVNCTREGLPDPQQVLDSVRTRRLDAVIQQITTRVKSKSGGKARRLRLGRWMFAHLGVVIADIRILTEVEGQRGRLFQSVPQYRFKREALLGKRGEAAESHNRRCDVEASRAVLLCVVSFLIQFLDAAIQQPEGDAGVSPGMAVGEEWMMQDKLAMFRMDAVTIDVTDDVRVNQEGGVVRALVVGYTVVGIYLGRR